MREVGDAAEIEHQERVQRILAFDVEDLVVDDMNQCVAGDDGRHEDQRRPLPLETRRPDHVGKQERRREDGVGPQQDSQADQGERAHQDDDA